MTEKDKISEDKPDISADALSDGEESLKHRLLGPSLTKAGQDKVDQQKVSEIIYNASRGSKFFNNEQVRDRALTDKISRILTRRDQLLKADLSYHLHKVDEYVAGLELGRDLTQTIVHMDCDAFYAAVEELDRPDLKNVPFAVGKGVLTTCNYEARKYGCRSGMAGFVARKLCPELICLPLNFDKYNAKAEEVRAIVAKYDPRFESASIDEAYLNITAYCAETELDPWIAMEKMRREIHESCKITVSAGIAANAKLAKIASNQKKPNGQFCISSDRQSIMAFMKDMPVRKVNGIGRVFERELDAIGIKTCGDIYEHRGILPQLFGDKAFEFLIQTYLGLGRTSVAPAEESERKSVGTERTFREIEGKDALRKKLRETAVELEGDLKRTEYKGRTLVLKVKLHSYEVISRQVVPPFAVHKADDLERFALPMLTRLEKEYPNMRLRLMGLRCTGLVSTAKTEVDFFGVKGHVGTNDEKPKRKVDADGWEIWPEADFEHAAEQERQEDFEAMEKLSQEYEAAQRPDKVTENASDKPLWDCPICHRPQPADEWALNEHIDQCLSRRTIGELVKEQKQESTMIPNQKSQSQTVTVARKRRGRSQMTGKTDERNVRQKAFFS
jgi:DNA polymerase kappa